MGLLGLQAGLAPALSVIRHLTVALHKMLASPSPCIMLAAYLH